MPDASVLLTGVSSLVLRRGHDVKSHHYAASTACRILKFAAILGFPGNGDVHRQSAVNPVPTKSVPFGNGLVDAQQIAGTYSRFQSRS